jgi:hypothetical protein
LGASKLSIFTETSVCFYWVKSSAAPDSQAARVFYYPQGSNLHPSTFRIHRPPPTPFREIASTVANNLLPNIGVFNGFDYMQDINALSKQSYSEFLRYANQLDPKSRIRLLGALNVRHVVSFTTLNIDGLKLERYFPEHPSWLYEIENSIPRAFITQRVHQETTPNQMMEQFAAQGFNASIDVFLDNPLPIEVNKDFAATANIVKYGNLSVVLQATSNRPGVLILADSYFPGWRVLSMAKKKALAPTIFRGVSISPGDHRVEFRYDPMMFKIGLDVL